MTAILTERRYNSGVESQRDVAIVRGLGARIWDDAGREYIDCVAGHGAANVGHCHPVVVAAIQQQAARLIICSTVFENDVRARLLERLVALAPGDLNRAFLANSGTEAVEAALKFARLSTGRPGIIAARQSFHGRSMGALSATWDPKYRKPYEPLVPGFTHVPYDDGEALRATVDDTTAAVILEVVQGEGGVNVGDPDYLRGAQEICRSRGALLIIDEVQTGFGRTGRMFACEHYGLEPDLMAVAKSMAGGVPMGACLIGPRVANLQPGLHGSTFGGNPLACAAALATLDVLTRGDLVAEAERKGAWVRERLRAIDSRLIREVRGLGLMIGVDLRKRVTPYLKALADQGVMALPAGSTVLRLLPPLVITDQELATVCDAVERVLTAEAAA
jgi:acetylornithine/LysW-gamma-L-lysine aminotransferase